MAAKQKNTKRKSSAKRKSLLRKKVAQSLPSIGLWVRRIVIAVVVLIVGVWAASWFILPHMERVSVDLLQKNIYNKTASAGFKVENILVEGRNHTDSDILLALLNIREGDPILLFDPQDAKEQIERIGWVKSARVERRLPNTIYVRLQERVPAALWQDGEGKLQLIDSDGEILTQKNLAAFRDLIMIKGEQAPEKSTALIALLKSEPKLFEAVDHAEFLDRRRWDLFLKNGMQVKLPEEDTRGAVRHLMIREEQDRILSKGSIDVIDARYKDRLIIRTRLGEVQDYKSGLVKTGTQL